MEPMSNVGDGASRADGSGDGDRAVKNLCTSSAVPNGGRDAAAVASCGGGVAYRLMASRRGWRTNGEGERAKQILRLTLERHSAAKA